MAKGKSGDTSLKEYNVWAMMRQRCTNPNAKNYTLYGARGITVCPEWSKFKNFYADMGVCPDGMTLDRVDNSKGYSKSNCRWASIEEQNNNKRNCIKITAFGKTQTVAQWAREKGLNRHLITYRIDELGMTPEEAMTMPKMSHILRKVKQFKNGQLIAEYDSLAEATKKTGISKGSIWNVLAGKAKTGAGYEWAYVE
jgi:hypothetical protein